MTYEVEQMQQLVGRRLVDEEKFEVLASISKLGANGNTRAVARDLLIRALEQAEQFENHQAFFAALLQDHGLLPYITPRQRDDLGFSDLVAYEAHRPPGLEQVVLHHVQERIYRQLMERKSVVLSAPTSFGKSLIIDAVVASGQFSSVVIIVPTIALMDETRRRISRFSDFKVVTHPSQRAGERTVYVMTQERFLEMTPPRQIDLFMVDEFYKLSGRNDEDGRAATLNRALYRLFKTGSPFYLAGPNIKALASNLPPSFEASFFATDYSTVAVDTIQIDTSASDEKSEVLRILSETQEPTLIYCRSIKRVKDVASWLLEESAPARRVPGLPDVASWVSQEFHPQWLAGRALRAGVGIHHGRLPRWLAQETLRAFNDGQINVLVCTSTLIEGVNTSAKNVIVLDNKIATKAYDFFTFNNIKGRSGRMFKHFVGRVYLFHPPPEVSLPEVDIPIFSQGSNAPDGIILQLDDEDASEESRRRREAYVEQDVLSIETIRENLSVEPADQIALARQLLADPVLARSLSWREAAPMYDNLRAAITVMWNFIPPAGKTQHLARSSSQLTYYMNVLARSQGQVSELLNLVLNPSSSEHKAPKPDDAVEDVFDFLRFWPGHNIPIRFRALESIAREVLIRMGIRPPSYGPYLARVNNYFDSPLLVSLEEYGVPRQTSSKLLRYIGRYDDLDELIDNLKNIRGVPSGLLSAFERRLLRQVREQL